MNPNLSIYASDFFSFVLIGMIVICNSARLRKRTEENLHLILILIFCGLSAIGSTLAFLFTDRGEAYQPLIVLFESICYLSNTMVALCWTYFLTNHLNGRSSLLRRSLLTIPLLSVIVLIIVNIFHPILFLATGTSYQRLYGYYIVSAIDFLYIIDSIILYLISLHKGGFLKLFPLWAFLFPVLAGFLVQTFVPDLTLEVPSILIGIVGVLFSLQNVTIYTDDLTGLYNRAYLDRLQDRMRKKSGITLYGIMIDVNDFKPINDNYGHQEGDEALKRFAIVLKQGVGTNGVAIRYAGDEFIALLNTQSEEEVKACIERIDKLLEEEKKWLIKPYDLSVSSGYDRYDSSLMSFEEFMKRIDQKMYRKKDEFYASHPEMDRRGRKED